MGCGCSAQKRAPTSAVGVEPDAVVPGQEPVELARGEPRESDARGGPPPAAVAPVRTADTGVTNRGSNVHVPNTISAARSAEVEARAPTTSEPTPSLPQQEGVESRGAMPASLAGHSQDASGLLFRDRQVRDKPSLAAAVKRGDVALVRRLIEQDSLDVNEPGMWGSTPLMLALQFVQIPVAELLLDMGAEVNTVNDRGGSALLYAALEGQVAMVERLLAAGCDARCMSAGRVYNSKVDDNQYLTPVAAAAVNGHADILRRLLLAGCAANGTTWLVPDTNNRNNKNNNNGPGTDRPDLAALTPVHALLGACKFGQPSTVQVLLEQPHSGIFSVDEEGRSALHLAVLGNNAEVLGLLLKCASDKVLRFSQQSVFTPQQQQQQQQQRVQQQQRLQSSPMTATKHAKDDGTGEEARFAELTRRANLTTVTTIATPERRNGHDNGPTDYEALLRIEPLGLGGTARKSTNGTCILTPSTVSVPLVTPRDAQKGSSADGEEVARSPTCAGAAPPAAQFEECPFGGVHEFINAPAGKRRQTTLHLACDRKQVESVRLLLQHGADVHVCDTGGQQPLHLAMRKRCLDVVVLLIDSGADPTMEDSNGRTPAAMVPRSAKNRAELLQAVTGDAASNGDGTGDDAGEEGGPNKTTMADMPAPKPETETDVETDTDTTIAPGDTPASSAASQVSTSGAAEPNAERDRPNEAELPNEDGQDQAQEQPPPQQQPAPQQQPPPQQQRFVRKGRQYKAATTTSSSGLVPAQGPSAPHPHPHPPPGALASARA